MICLHHLMKIIIWNNFSNILLKRLLCQFNSHLMSRGYHQNWAKHVLTSVDYHHNLRGKLYKIYFPILRSKGSDNITTVHVISIITQLGGRVSEQNRKGKICNRTLSKGGKFNHSFDMWTCRLQSKFNFNCVGNLLLLTH